MTDKTLKIMVATMILAASSATIFALQTATRIRFARGKSSATVSGTVGKYGKKDYVVRGLKGQELSAVVSSGCASVTLDVIDKGTGQSLTEPTTDYRDELPGTDDFIIRVQNSDLPACKFTLKVGIE
jgi:hypothetical protein